MWGIHDFAFFLFSADFPTWGGLCESGRYQSPIDLSMCDSLKGEFKELQFENYDKKQEGPLVVNNRHSIQIYNFPRQMKLGGGPLSNEYIAQQLHFHWWSEHTIDKVRYPLECHIVHVNARYANMSEAVKHRDGIAVVGVLYHVSNYPNDGIADVLDYVEKVKSYEQINKPVKMKEFTVAELIPEFKGYFTYDGSLTTPTCAESVTWILLHSTFPITLQQVEKFKQVEYDKDKPLRNNYRFVQKTRHRPVVAVTYNVNEKSNEIFNSAVGLQMSFNVLLIVAFVGSVV